MNYERMSIVPKEVVQEMRRTWSLSTDPLEAVVEATAKWALERAAQICDAQAERARTSPGSARADACANAIRALLKGGESDAQGN